MKKIILLISLICLTALLAAYNETEGNDTQGEANVIPTGSNIVTIYGETSSADTDWFQFSAIGQDHFEVNLASNTNLVIQFRNQSNGAELTMFIGETTGQFDITEPSGLVNWTIEIFALTGTEAYELTLTNADNNTLPVTLSSFNAANTTEGTVELKWTVQSETEMLGYNLLRNATDNEETAIGINGTPIPALNTSFEHSYSFEDIDVEVNTTYYYWIESIEIDNNVTYHGPVQITVKPEDEEQDAELIKYTKITKNYPNPFNPQTKISYDLSGYTDTEVPVSLIVYNIRGQKVKTLIDGYQTPGKGKSIDWFGKDDNGNDCSSGVYFYVLKTNDTVKTSKMTLLK